MNFCYYSTPFSSHGKCISVFGTSSPSFLGSVKIESIMWLGFFPMYSIGNYHSWTVSSLHKTSGKKLLFLTIYGILNMFFILGFILLKCYFYASSLSWMLCSAHSLPPFLKVFSMQCWKIFACEQGRDIPIVFPKVLCYLEPSWRVFQPCLRIWHHW